MPAKPKRISLGKAKRIAWKAFSEYIRVRDGIRTTGSPDQAVCCSCGKAYPTFGVGCIQAGHFLPGRHASVLFDERGVHAQCYVCNVRMKGNWARYYEFMLTRYGQEVIDDLMRRDKMIVQPLSYELLEKAKEWESKTRRLRNLK